MIVAILTLEQKDQLVGQFFEENSIFNPILDGDDNWVISIEEINNCTNNDFIWIKELVTSEYLEPDEPVFN